MHNSYTKMNKSISTTTREEERKARARAENARHIAKVQKEKNWLSSNTHIVAQQQHEKEERRKTVETLRNLGIAVKDEPEKQKKKNKPVNAFAALCESDSESEKEEEQKEKEKEEAPVTVAEKMPVFNAKRFIWADEDD